MKPQICFSGLLVTLFLMFIASCQQQSSDEAQTDVTEIKNGMQEVTELIDESIREDSVFLFINKTDLALNELDMYVDQYLAAMDSADEKVSKDPRNSIIRIKQTMTGIDLRLALLDDENLIGINPFNELSEGSGKVDRIRPTAYPYSYPFSMATTPPYPENLDEGAVEDMENYAKEIHKEIVNELKELETEIDDFLAETL
jgi:hypothetical protein